MATVWDAVTGKSWCNLTQEAQVNLARVFPDGAKVVTAGFDADSISIWDIDRCIRVLDLPIARSLVGLALLEGGQKVVIMAHDGSLAVWCARSGAQLSSFGPPPPQRISDRDFRLQAFPRGDRLLTFGLDSATIWNATTGTAVHRLSFEGIDDVVVSQGGDVVVTCGNHKVTVWETATGRILHTFEEVPLRRPAGDVVPDEEMSDEEMSEDEYDMELDDVEEGWPDDVSDASSLLPLTDCRVALGLSTALDPRGIGSGLSWRDLP